MFLLVTINFVNFKCLNQLLFFCFRSDIPFSEWNTDTLCDWLIDLGLESCVTEARRWVKSGAQLLAASTHEIEKELGIKVME